MSNRHGKHKKDTATCAQCGTSFERKRIVLAKQRIKLCRAHMRLSMPYLSHWPTYRLKEVIRNEGRTDAGGDFEIYLDDIKEELYNREQKEMLNYIEEMTE